MHPDYFIGFSFGLSCQTLLLLFVLLILRENLDDPARGLLRFYAIHLTLAKGSYLQSCYGQGGY